MYNVKTLFGGSPVTFLCEALELTGVLQKGITQHGWLHSGPRPWLVAQGGPIYSVRLMFAPICKLVSRHLRQGRQINAQARLSKNLSIDSKVTIFQHL